MDKKIIKKKKILIVGGHLTPALAVASELIETEVLDILWAGTKYSQTTDKSLSAEFETVKSRRIRFIDFKAGKLWRKWTPQTLPIAFTNLINIPLGFIRAVVIISKEKPDLVLSFGGYLALPIVIVARMFGKKIITHEQTVVIGLANKIIALFAHKVCHSWGTTLTSNDSKNVFTGNPVRKEVFASSGSEFKFQNKLPTIFITGGNQGANTINKRISPILSELLKHANVIHQTGKSSLTNDFAKAMSDKNNLEKEKQDRYIVVDRIFGNEIGEAFHRADLVLSRSGANTITELLLLAKPAVLIPIPWSSNNEQQKNAEMLAKIGLAKIIRQYDELPAETILKELLSAIQLLKDGKNFINGSLENTKVLAKTMVKKDAAKIIAKETLKLLGVNSKDR